MTILYLADTRFPIERANGLQTMATCHALAARGHGLTLVVRPDTAKPPRDPFEYYGLPPLPTLSVERIARARGLRARRAQFLLGAARRVFRVKPDVVLTRDLGVAAFLLQLPAARRPRVVYESHGLSTAVAAEMPSLLGKPELAPSSRKLRRLDRRERRVWQHASAYVTITQALADELTARYGARDRLFVIPDGATLVQARSQKPEARSSEPGNLGTPDLRTPDPGPRPPVAAYAGHLYPWKGVDVFLRALALTPNVRGLIVGGHPAEADLARVMTLVHDLGLDSRVEITGFVRPGDVRERLSPATMLVLPNTPSAISERYTSPLKLFEYLAMAQPIIASDVPAIREILTDGETALLASPGDAESLARAMARLASDANLSSALARAAGALAPAYTWERRAERLEAALAAALW